MGKKMEVIARGVCLKAGKILLCQTAGAGNTYLPGGHVEFNETARAGLEREIVEELGADSTAGRFLGMVEHSFIQKSKRHCEWNAVFALTIPELLPDAPVIAAESHISFRWCDLGALQAARLEPAVLCDCLPQWLDAAFVGPRWVTGGDFLF